MQSVKLTSYQKPERNSNYTLQKRFYCFAVPGCRIYFKSERRLRLWLGELNRQLNALLTETNCIYAEVFREYRYYYLHYNSTERNKFEQRFIAIDKTFDLLATRCHGRSSNHWAFQYFERIATLLTETIETLSSHSMNQLATVQRMRLNNLATRISSIKYRLNELPPGYDRIKNFG